MASKSHGTKGTIGNWSIQRLWKSVQNYLDRYAVLPVSALNNKTESRLVTIGNATTELDGEANLTYDGTTFTVNDNMVVGSDGSGHDVTFYSATSGDSFLWDASEEKLTIVGTNGQNALDITDGNVHISDNLVVDGTFTTANDTEITANLVADGSIISLDSTSTFNIDCSNTTNGITIGTATVNVPISIGHTTSETTVNDNLTVTGDLTVNGTTTSINQTTIDVTNAFVFEGATANAHETTLAIIDPTADATINLPAMDAGTYCLPVLAAASTTAVSSTPEELNLLDGVSGGTVVNSKAVIYSSDGDINVGDDLTLSSDSSLISLGVDADFTITHDGDEGATIAGSPVTITSAESATWSCSAGDLIIDANNGDLTLDGLKGITLQTAHGSGDMAGNIILDSLYDIILDADGDNVTIKFGGAAGQIDFSHQNSGEGVIKQGVDGKDLVIKQYDGTEVVRFTDDLKLKFKDDGDEWIQGTGTDLILSAGGDIRINSATSKLEWGEDSGEHIVGDGSNGLIIASGNKITLDALYGIDIDSWTGDVTFMDGGVAQLALDMDTTNFEIFFQLKVDGDDLVFKQYDGNEVIRIADDRKLYFYDQGGEHISSDGTDMTIGSGRHLNLTATNDVIIPVNVGLVLDGSGNEKIESDGTDINISVGASGDINIPADIGLTFGNDGEKIEGDGTDLTISGNNINLTAVEDVNIPSGVGLTFATTEKIESDGTDLTITVGSNGDINIPADIGLTFGDDGEKIEGDGTDLTISGNNINLTAVDDVNIPSGVGLTFATTEKIESDGTDLTITVGSSGDINIPADIGLTFGNDGEKIEGDGTDLTISGNNINLTAVEDVVVPADVGITFGTGEKIEGDNTDLTITSGADIKLTAAAFVEIPANIPLTFDGTGQADKISSDGTDMTIAVGGGDIILDASDDVHIDAGGDLVNLKKAGTTHATFDMSATDDLIVKDTGGTEIFRIDGSADSLLMASTNKIEFNDASQFIHGSSATVLSIGATDEIDLTATTIDINGILEASTVAGSIIANRQTLDTAVLPANHNAVLIGPITVGSEKTVTISDDCNVKIIDFVDAFSYNPYSPGQNKWQ